MRPRKARILLADDNSAIRSALALLLENRLHVDIVGEAESMEQLMTNVECFNPDIVILDWDLPGLPKDGQVSVLRSVHAPLKVVATSARPEVAQQALEAQADAYVCTCEQPELVVQVLRTIWKFPNE
jgi:two-component system response regulator DesR